VGELAGLPQYTGVEWRPDRGTNLLVGDNGAGKTNLLEAVHISPHCGRSGAVPTKRSWHMKRLGGRSGFGGADDGRATTLIEIEIRRRGPRRVQVNRSDWGASLI
jgi:recombinational DNA repair ATPase RecF